MPDFFEVTRKDNWGDITDSAGDFPLGEGDSVEVIFPDGSREERMIEVVKETTHRSDMGYSEDVVSDIPCVRVRCRGMSIKVVLFGSGIKVRPINKWVGPLEALQKKLKEMREKRNKP